VMGPVDAWTLPDGVINLRFKNWASICCNKTWPRKASRALENGIKMTPEVQRAWTNLEESGH